MNADVLATRVADGIAIITLGSARRIYFDQEMGDALTEALDGFAGDAKVRVVVITGGAPGYFNRHFDVGVLIDLAESLRASGREWPENATYNGGFFDKAMALCESMPKPVIAAISGTALAGAFEFALACDLRIAEDGDYLIGLPEAHLGLLPGAGGLIARLLLGLIFLVFGLNGFLNFLSMGPMPTGLAGQFIGALFMSHYYWIVAGLQVIGGLLLLVNRFVPLALVLLGPVIVNIICYHVFLNPVGWPLALVVTILWFIVFCVKRQYFSGIFVQRT